MDHSHRQRYEERRRRIAARRRRIALLLGSGLGLVLIVGLGAFWRYTRPAVLEPTVAPVAQTQSVNPTAAQGVVEATTAAPPVAQPTLAPTQPIQAAPPSAAAFFDDQRLTYEPNFYVPQVQAFLDTQAGPLKTLSFAVGGRSYPFAQVLIGQTSYYSVNPKIILALLEQRNALLSTASPSGDQYGWALGYQGENGNRRGLQSQVRWGVRQMLLARHDYPSYAPLTYADNSTAPPPAGMSLSQYALARVLAPTTTPDRLPALMDSFLATYIRLFGDPRLPPTDWPKPAEPFLSWPMEKPAPITSFFDHGGPFLTRNAQNGVTTYWGRTEMDIAFAYNGHDGWDYAAAPPDLALAAADGDVVFAGNADDNCATRAVIVDHRNGYRTLYWHLDRIDVELGQSIARGQPVGMIGSTGCATGPHLHFGVQFLGRNTDPYGWCASTSDPWQQNPAGTMSVWLWNDRPSPCAVPRTNVVVVDTDSKGFVREGEGWQNNPVGVGGGSLFVPSLRGSDPAAPLGIRSLTRPAVAVWQPTLPAKGRYRVLAYVPYALTGLEDARDVRYRVRYAEGEAEINVDITESANDWVDLGTYDFDPNDKPAVSISNLAEGDQLTIWADAIMWVPAQ